MGNRRAIGATTQDDETLNGPLMGETPNAYGRSSLVRIKKHLVSHQYRSIGIGEHSRNDTYGLAGRLARPWCHRPHRDRADPEAVEAAEVH